MSEMSATDPKRAYSIDVGKQMRKFLLAVFILFSTTVFATQSAIPSKVAGHYRAVTETEYSIDLDLQPEGSAKLEFTTWEADGSAPDERSVFKGTWSLKGKKVLIRLSSGKFLKYEMVPCLPYTEFGQKGCSAGLRYLGSNLPDRYELNRFGLWNSRKLKLKP
jgi:hypothetical protein